MLLLKNFRPDWGYRADRQGGQVINLDLPNAHFLPYRHVKGCVKLSLHLHTMSADQPWPSLQVSWSALTLGLSIYGILRGVSCSYILKDQIIVSKPWKCMEFSIHTHSISGWWGNTIPMVWSTICVHMKWAFHRGLNRSVCLYLGSIREII